MEIVLLQKSTLMPWQQRRQTPP